MTRNEHTTKINYNFSFVKLFIKQWVTNAFKQKNPRTSALPTIQQWGNSLAIRLSGPLRAIPQLEAGMKVDIQISDEELRIRPIRRKKQKRWPFTEAELLADLSAENIHANLLATPIRDELGHG